MTQVPRPVVPMRPCWPHPGHHQDKVVESMGKRAGIKSELCAHLMTVTPLKFNLLPTNLAELLYH